MNAINIITGLAVFNNITIIFQVFLFMIQLCGIKYRIIHGDKDTTRHIVKHLERDTYSSSVRTIGAKILPSDYFIGWKAIGYYENGTQYIEDNKIYIITTAKYYDYITREPDFIFDKVNSELTVSNKINIEIYNRLGEYKRFYYRKIRLDVSQLNPIGQQQTIVTDIAEKYRKTKQLNVFIHGVPAAGKSSIGYLLAKELRGKFCHSFNPTDPGDSLSNMLSEIISDGDYDDVPLIIVIEEADIMIDSIHKNTVRHIRDIPTPIHNKASWNTFLDDMIFYKNVIIILTSNISKESIDKLDPAYLRKGRINSYYSMMEPLVTCDL